ncbi:protein Wiz-like isoform X3 [Narcine bancroftii]|uniref:protein Wiz-like isoform X3 n=1 Tax=Narcine bancroftii TaxID=1343680 RepID=UPI0038319C5D
MEKNSHQELIQWDEELQTNISKGFCSPDDVLNLSGEQVRTRLLQQNSGGEGLHVSGKGEMSGGTSCLLECEQSLAGVPPLLRTTPISRSRVEFESHYPDPRGYKPLEQQTHVGHKEPIHPDPRPVGAKLGPALTHPILTENLTSAPNRCSQSSSFSSCLPENILDGINLNTSVVGGKELLTAYIQEEQDMHTLNTVRSAAVEGILYGFDLSCERSGNEYTPLDQMTYEYDVTCGEEVQYTSLDPVSYSFDVSCEPDEDVNTLVDPMSYEFEVSCARDDDSMECFNQSTLNDGKEDVMTSMVRGAKTPGNSHGALGSWSETELVIGSPEHQSNSGSSTVTTVRNEGSSSVTATTVISVIASREEMLPEVEVHQTTSVVKGNTPAEMKRSPDGDEPTTVCYHQYLSTSQDKEPCQSEMDECFSEQRVDGSVEPANTLVANYTPSFCQAASWDCATTTAADSGGNPSRSTSKISTECDVESSGASSAHQPQKSFSSLDGESPDLSASDSTEGPNPSGQLVQTTEEDTDTIQPAFSLFANEREKSWGSPANQKGDVLTEPPLVKTVGPSREEQPDDEVPESPAANTSSLFSLHVSTARQHSPLSPASMETIYRSAEKTFRTENPGRTEQVVRTSSDSEGTSKKLCLPEHEEKSISKDSREPGLAPMASVSVVSKVQNNEPLNNCSENSEASQEKVRHQNENGEQGTGEQQIWESKQLAVEIGTTCRESAMVSVAGAEETLEAQVNIPDKHEVSKLQGIGMDCQLQYAKPVLKPATEPASGRVHNGEEDLKMTSAEVVGAFGEPPLYTCTKCSVYFQDKEFLHRHMLDHFDVHSGEGLGGGLRPFSCQECGHCFCDPASLQSHMSLHQARRASFMEAIQELAEPRGKEHGVRPQCPQSRFGADLSISVEEHVETHAHADPHTREVQVATADLRDHALLYHPDSFRDGKTLTLSNPRMLPQASKINLHTGKEYPSIRRDEMGCVKYGQQSLYQQKASCPLSSSAWLSADQESEDLHAQPDKREIPQKFPLSSLDPQPERGSLPSVAKNPCQYQAKHLVLKGDWKSKMALETSGNKFKMHSLVGTANKVWPHNVQHRSPMSPCQRLGVHNDTRLTIFTLPEGSRHPPKGANNPTADLPRKEIEVGSEGGTTLGSALTYRKVIIDHFSSKMTSNGPPVPKAIVSGNMEVATGNRMSNVLIETENLSQKTSGCTEHINIAWSLCDKRRRKSGELSAASCRPRVVKKHTKEILETVNIPTDLLVTQRQQLVRMTPLILLDKMETQPESKLTNDDQDLESSSELRDIHPQNAPVNGLPWEQTETHSIHKPPNDLSQLEPMESRSCCKSDRSHSQPKSIESCSCEPTENQSLCKSLNSHHQYASLENHSCESMETHSQHNPINSHSLPEKTPLRCESTCTNPQRDSLGSRSQPYPFSEEDSFPEIQADRNIFWEVPSEELTIDLMKKSKDLLSRNLLHMFPLEERECPYCPDKFHTGIGLANHVRGHLKRVGISYNTRHFVSAEEVTAIEKQFSLQKLKRKALKFRGGVVEKCNLCGASFDSRAGMSSHARAHLRELGVVTWSATSSPIDLLNELLQDQLPPGPADGQPATDATSRRLPNHRSGAATAVPEASSPHLLGKPFTSVNHSSPPQRNKVVIIDPDDDEEMATLELDLPSGLSSGETELQEKNGFMETLDSNSHPKQSLSKIALVSQGEESLQSNKLLNSCQLCGTCFETRKGLSSHARFHLRQFGVPDSESSGAPIGTLYELMKRKGIPNVLPSALSNDKPQSYAPKDLSSLTQEALGKPLGEECQGEAAQTAKSPKLGMNSPTKGQSQTSTLKKVHPILPKPVSSKSPEPGKTGRSLMNTPQTSGELLSKKLFWSPQDDNTPLNLTVNSEHISCRLCGACFETRKGLSSHSRAHLRHFGAVDMDSKGSPIEALNEFIKKKGIQSALSSMLPMKKAHSYHKVSSLKAERSNFKLGAPVNKKTSVTSPSMSTQKKLKHVTMGVHMESGISQASRPNNGLTSETYWPTSPINLSIDSAPSKETRCEFCGDYFENRKGLSSHARSHLRQFGVTEWTVNGSPIDTLKELMKRKMHPLESSVTPGLKEPPKPAATSMKSPTENMQGEPFSPSAGRSTKFSLTIPSIRQVPSGSLIPKKVQGQFLSLSPLKKMKPNPLKKVKQEHFKIEYNSEEPATSLKSDSYLPEQMWPPRGDTSPLHLIDQPSKDVRCEFCGEYFENRKGLSSHARSHLRQFGVTEWTVNGSPIDTLKELMKRKEKPEPLGHDPEQQEPQSYQYEEKHISKPFGQMIKSPVKEMHQKHLTPPARKVLTYTPNSQHSTLSPLGKKIPMGFVSTAPLKKSMPDERSMPHELKASYSPESGSYKPKSAWSPHEKVTTTPVIAADTCCELCGHYFENRKALASHARAHLRQFGVTEWHINGSPIDTLREWIRQKPNISPGTSLNCVQDRPLPKPIRNNIKSLVKELPGELCSLPGGKTVKLEPMQPKTVELGFPASPVQKNPETEKMSPTECYTPTDLSQSSITECTPSSSMPSEDEEPHPKKKRKHPVKLGTCEYCGVTLTTGVGLSNHMRGHLKSGLKRKLPSLSQFEELHEKAEPALTDTYNERKQQKPAVCTENLSPKHEEGKEPKTFRSKSEEPKPLRVRPVIFPVLKPEPLSLVKFIGNIYTLKCRFCDVEFHGPLSIQEEWVRHLQRHILDVNFPKVEAAREEISTSAEPEK